MEENKYLSIYMHKETTKDDLSYFSEKYPFKYDKKDILSLVLLILTLLSIILVGFVAYCIIITFGLLIALAWYRIKFVQKKRIAFLSHLESSIIKDNPNMTAISAVYPLYIKYDNSKKFFILNYKDNEILNFEYSDLISYNIYIDGYKTQHNRLKDVPDRTAKSYKVELLFKHGKSAEIGLANINKYIKLYKSYSYLQYTNTKTINNILIMFDKIIKKNKI